MSTSVVTRDGEIALPDEIRQALGVKAGDRVRLVPQGNSVRIERVSSIVVETRGAFSGAQMHDVQYEEREVVEQAIADDVVERMRAST